MEPIILVLCILMLIVSLASLGTAVILLGKIKAISHSDNDTKKLDELKESVYNEFSRNRTEQNRLGQAQREEVSKQISELNKRLQTLTDTNQEQLIRMYREMASGINTIRD